MGFSAAARRAVTQAERQGAQNVFAQGVWVVEERGMVSRQMAQSRGLRGWSGEGRAVDEGGCRCGHFEGLETNGLRLVRLDYWS